VNLTSAFVTAQAVARRMIERGEAGRIIFLSSAIGSGGNPVHRAVGYSATKGGLNNLTRHLAVEWARYNITVNAIAPSYVPTEMTIDPEHGDVAPGQKSRMELFTPMGRLGRPDEIATAVLFLAAPASTYVTGSIVAVDGGWTAWVALIRGRSSQLSSGDTLTLRVSPDESCEERPRVRVSRCRRAWCGPRRRCGRA
jgi:NAD(P)-dependent dehydrogenase (short-subunit alcohol dehydrogenase family)